MADDFDNIIWRHGRQIRRIDKKFLRLHRAMRAAQARGARRDFIADAVAVLKRLGGPPGAGAVEIYDDLRGDLERLHDFIMAWSDLSQNARARLARTMHKYPLQFLNDVGLLLASHRLIRITEKVINAAAQLHQEMLKFQAMVDNTDIDQLREVRDWLQRSRDRRGRQ